MFTNQLGHYPTRAARLADFAIHVTGLTLAVICSAFLLTVSYHIGGWAKFAAIAIYCVGLVAMLSASTIYNFASDDVRPFLAKFDHSAIFLMIAGSYTPFTTQNLSGDWAIFMTLSVWGLALLGIAGQFFEILNWRLWIVLYIVLGWIGVVAIEPIASTTSATALWLLLAGGVLYTTGVLFHVNRQLHFSRAIWHGHVVAAAGTHWTAILLGVVLSGH